ncbi:glycerate kinase, partial [Pseudomonas marginalis]
MQIQLACDVNNPLVGPQGAANIFGPQKGASPAMVDQLEQGMNNFADVIEKITGIDYRAYPGGGAAGGLAMAAIAFMNALVTSGIELVMQASG